MKTLFRLVMLVLTLGGWALSAASLYVIRTPDRLSIIPRDRVEFLKIHEVWVDTRAWTLEDASAHPAVVRRLIAREKADLLQHVAPDAHGVDLTRLLQEAADRGESAPTAAPAGPDVRRRIKSHLADAVRSRPPAAAESEDRHESDSAVDWLRLALSLDF